MSGGDFDENDPDVGEVLDPQLGQSPAPPAALAMETPTASQTEQIGGSCASARLGRPFDQAQGRPDSYQPLSRRAASRPGRALSTWEKVTDVAGQLGAGQVGKTFPIRPSAEREKTWGEVANAMGGIARIHDAQVVLGSLAWNRSRGGSQFVSQAQRPSAASRTFLLTPELSRRWIADSSASSGSAGA